MAIKKKDLTKDDLIKIIIEGNRQMTEATMGVKDALRDLNDNNVLHRQALDNNTRVIRDMVQCNEAVMNMIKWVFLLIIAALVVLAGAEKVFELLPNLQNII